ncbi:hypothetical protein [Aureimonas sp. AU4]|nr:hypothetical protein [Aureimonas sp. AU4]
MFDGKVDWLAHLRTIIVGAIGAWLAWVSGFAGWYGATAIQLLN